MVNRPGPAETVTVEDFDEDLCLFRRDIDEVLVLNTSAGDVWRLADGSMSVPQIVTRLAAAYRVPEQRLADDVQSLVEDLLARGYLVEVP